MNNLSIAIDCRLQQIELAGGSWRNGYEEGTVYQAMIALLEASRPYFYEELSPFLVEYYDQRNGDR